MGAAYVHVDGVGTSASWVGVVEGVVQRAGAGAGGNAKVERVNVLPTGGAAKAEHNASASASSGRH